METMKRIFAALLALVLCASCAFAEAGLTNFETYALNTQEGADVQGEKVTQAIFADYDLTLVNIWATWCGYCVQEMPELAKLKDMLPENVNLISICDDASSEAQLACKILQESGATNFPTLIASQEMYDQFLNQVYAFPTTCFIDSEGRIVGETITGVPSLEDAAQSYLAIINEVLKTLED